MGEWGVSVRLAGMSPAAARTDRPCTGEQSDGAVTAIPRAEDAAKPLIYSCSGCSSAAQLANHLAIRMDREGEAEMSCIAGLGGDVRPLVRTAAKAAESGRPIIMIDGCPLHCGRHTLARHGIQADLHWDLSRMQVGKEKHVDFDPADAARLEPELTEAVRACQACAVRR